MAGVAKAPRWRIHVCCLHGSMTWRFEYLHICKFLNFENNNILIHIIIIIIIDGIQAYGPLVCSPLPSGTVFSEPKEDIRLEVM